MLRAAYTTHSGMSSSQKFCCCRIDFLQYLVLIFSIPRDISFLLFFHCKFLSNICPTFLYFWQHNNSKRKSHYLYSDSHLYNSPSINVPSSFLSQAVRNAFNDKMNSHHSVCLCCRNSALLLLFSSSFCISNKLKGIERIQNPAWFSEQEKLGMAKAEVLGGVWRRCFAGDKVSYFFTCSISNSLNKWFSSDQHAEVGTLVLFLFVSLFWISLTYLTGLYRKYDLL